MMRKNKFLLIFLLIALLAGAALNKFYFKEHGLPASKPASAQENITQSALQIDSTQANNHIPQKVYTVLKYVQEHHKAMDGYVGGREFQNREKRLPIFTPENKPVSYREWDVNPKIEHQNRGAERLITGNDNTAWYTANHYKSFTKIK